MIMKYDKIQIITRQYKLPYLLGNTLLHCINSREIII